MPSAVHEGPLSRAQRGLWFLSRLRPASAAYNLATAARVQGELSTAEIRAFFQAMVDRHAALRSTFRREDEEPVQVVQERLEVAFEEIDAETWTDAELRAGVEEAAWRPFDLERGPVFRVALFGRGPERVLVVAMHHIVADFGSIGLFQEPAGASREGAKEYADFVAWQEELLAGPEGERLWSWWRERLAGLSDLDLPVDRPLNRTDRSDQSDRSDLSERTPGGACRREIGPDTLARLKALARSRRGTLYVTLLAAFQTLLHRYTGQEDFAVGSPAAGRPRGFGRTYGYFTNPLVMRADLEGDPSFRELVDRTRQTVSKAQLAKLSYRHPNAPPVRSHRNHNPRSYAKAFTAGALENLHSLASPRKLAPVITQGGGQNAAELAICAAILHQGSLTTSPSARPTRRLTSSSGGRKNSPRLLQRSRLRERERRRRRRG